MTPPSTPIRPGGPSRVIQGFFPAGRPTTLQALLAPTASAPGRPAPAVAQPPLFLTTAPPQAIPGRSVAPPAPVFPTAMQPKVAPGRAIAPPAPLFPAAMQPKAAPARPTAPPLPTFHTAMQPKAVPGRPAAPPASLFPARPGAAQPAMPNHRLGHPQGAILPSRPGAILPRVAAGRPGAIAAPILPVRPAAILPKTVASPTPVAQPTSATGAILPPAVRPGALQPYGSDAFALPSTFRLRPPGTGQRLPEAVQRKMESFFKSDFSAVRVHVGQEAGSIGALAFAIGTDLYFAPGQYQPETVAGQRLLGHELTHVVQQRAGRVRNPLGGGLAVVQDLALEAEAERMGTQAAAIQLSSKSQGLLCYTVPSQMRGNELKTPVILPLLSTNNRNLAAKGLISDLLASYGPGHASKPNKAVIPKSNVIQAWGFYEETDNLEEPYLWHGPSSPYYYQPTKLDWTWERIDDHLGYATYKRKSGEANPLLRAAVGGNAAETIESAISSVSSLSSQFHSRVNGLRRAQTVDDETREVIIQIGSDAFHEINQLCDRISALSRNSPRSPVLNVINIQDLCLYGALAIGFSIGSWVVWNEMGLEITIPDSYAKASKYISLGCMAGRAFKICSIRYGALGANNNHERTVSLIYEGLKFALGAIIHFYQINNRVVLASYGWYMEIFYLVKSLLSIVLNTAKKIMGRLCCQ